MKIHLTGDSITAAGRDPGDPADLGNGYVARLAAGLPGHEFANTGINGHRVTDLQERWERDVLVDKPDLLSIKIGANDTWHGFLRNGLKARITDTLLRVRRTGTTTADFEAGYRELLERSRASGIERIILVEPFLIPVDAGQQQMLPDLEEKMAVVRRLADEFGTLFVPLHQEFTHACTNRDPEELVIDGVHPTPAGHDLIAQQWLSVVRPEVLDG